MNGEKVRLNIIGQAGSGKSTLATYLAERFGFGIFTPSDAIREYAKPRGIQLQTREDYVKAHAQMLQDNPDAIIEPIVSSEEQRLLVDGLRVPTHVDILRQREGLITLALDCSVAVRFEHMLAAPATRQYRDTTVPMTFEDFVANEVIDNTSSDPSHPNVVTVMQMADLTIDSSQPLYKVHEQAAFYVESIL
jgi:adenylate kinase family enzyme